MNKKRSLSRNWVRGSACATLVSLWAVACAIGNDTTTEDLGATASALTSAQCAALDIHKSLVVHDTATLNPLGPTFELRKTLQAIINSSGVPSTTPEDLLQSLIVDFSVSSATQPVSGLALPVDTRAEATLNSADLLSPSSTNGMVPVALFNRLDAAPSDGSHCGEHRIVYAKKNTFNGRFFLIFEAVLPNPTPALGIAGCKPVAEFWGSLSDPALFPTVASRTTALENFYYNGLPGFEPVVTHAHYGVPFGQVRSNHFLNFVNWQLREWRTSFDAAGAPTFQMDTDKQTPLTEFYDSTFAAGVGDFAVTNPALFATERTAFQSDFITNQIAHLAAPELAGATSVPADIINGTSSAFPNRFNEFQSHAQFPSDIPRDKALHSSALVSSFASNIAAVAPAAVNADQLLNRAGAMTCGGCHQFSAGTDIGKIGALTVTWPNSAFFVHVTETGGLSEALDSFFLPARMKILKDFACTGSGGSGGSGGAGGSGGSGGSGAGGSAGAGGSSGGPTVCGYAVGNTCGASEFCSVCLGSSTQGVCGPRPESCLPYGPEVCGCDGNTYTNACTANSVGVAVQHSGSCGGTKDICAPDEAVGQGLCKLPLGFKWNGKTCQAVSGCSCKGADCDELFNTQKECTTAHRFCIRITPCLLKPCIEPLPCVGKVCLLDPIEEPIPLPGPGPIFPPMDSVSLNKSPLTAQTSITSPTSPKKVELAPLAQDVALARETVVKDAAQGKANKDNVVKLEKSVALARETEQAMPGAFVPRRRTH